MDNGQRNDGTQNVHPSSSDCFRPRPAEEIPWPAARTMNRKELVQELDALQDKFKLQQKHLTRILLQMRFLQ
jgi:hypothetical protein